MNNYYFLDKSIFTSFSPKVVNFVYAPHPFLNLLTDFKIEL
jgi:hypothetical protein